jgi:amino acid transporter
MQMARRIGLYAATCITIGNIVGSGIFRSPSAVAGYLDNEAVVLGAWILGGLMSLCGALVVAELGTLYPAAGGVYVFLREAFGRAWAFTFGWANFLVLGPTVIASIASVFASYLVRTLPVPESSLASAELGAGLAAILLITAVNMAGVHFGTGTQNLFTTAKIVGILLLVIAAFTLTPAAPGTGAPAAEAAPAAGSAASSGSPFFLLLASAMIPIFFAYDGWIDLTFVAGEVDRPRRNLPLAIVGGTLVVVTIYVLAQLAYSQVMTLPEMAAEEAVGAETAVRLLGRPGERLLAVLVMVSAFGTLNGSILTRARVTMAMAADDLFWKPLAAVHRVRKTPHVSLMAQGLLACLWLSVARGFEDVSGWFVTSSWLFYGLTVAALFVIRRRGPGGDSYKVPLYPITPAVFLVVTTSIIVSDLASSGWRAASGVLIAALGLPVYALFWRSRRG